MDDETMDVCVVGAGIAGCVTAIELARAGKEVVLVERGATPGQKNLSGGVFYSRVMEKVFPDFYQRAPYERAIVRNVLGFLNEQSMVSIDYSDQRLHPTDSPNAVSVLRSKFDAWLAQQAEEAGVMVMPETKVDAVLKDGDSVVGVKIGEDDVPARVVVLADGVNSFLARDAGLRRDQEHHELAVGIKSIWKLDRETINSRFHVDDGEGVAYAIVGQATQGVGGGGFIYTNDDTVSIGVVLRLDSLVASGKASSDIHDAFVTHPHIKPLIRDAELIEYGSHMVNEGGYNTLEPLVGNGVVIVGDAAGMTINNGATIRGMDLAAASGIAAAKGIVSALDSGDYSSTGLAGYPTALKESSQGKDMATYAKAPEFLMNQRLFEDYGPLLGRIMFDIYRVDDQPKEHMGKVARQALKQSPVSMMNVIGDGLKAMRSL